MWKPKNQIIEPPITFITIDLLMKLKFPFMAAIICTITMSLPLMSCGNDEDDEPEVPAKPSASIGLMSIAGHGQTLFAFEYDASGRMTKLSAPAYQYTIEISYKPLKLTLVDEVEGAVMTMTDISTNSDGYITKTSFNEDGEGCPTTMSYDSDGHLTSITSDGEVSHFSWTNGNLMKVAGADGGIATFDYSSLDNTAGVFSPLWSGIMGMLWMTDLFGTAPANFPSSINSDGDIALFSYTLNANGTINTEQFTYGGVTATFDYYYTGDRAVEDGAAEVLPTVFKHNIFRRSH